MRSSRPDSVCSQRLEARLVDVELGVALARLLLGQADGADLGRGEDGGRHHRVIDGDGLVAEHGVGEGMALADGDGREVHAIGHVAHGIDVVDRRAGVLVDRDRAVVRRV